MAHFTCHTCGQPCNKLIIPAGESGKKNFEDGKEKAPGLRCENCHTSAKNFTNVNLGQTTDVYTRRDGSKGRITYGKAWEIESRTLSPEGVVINKHTGKETQY